MSVLLLAISQEMTLVGRIPVQELYEAYSMLGGIREEIFLEFSASLILATEANP